ncbi:hypothetical protein RB195_007696 [Necator americanus]|uniref:Uncharacterized protein n=1 Tax=Necator americanus TaxID=51031 RepID=A0ABR1BYG4_NECAM
MKMLYQRIRGKHQHLGRSPEDVTENRLCFLGLIMRGASDRLVYVVLLTYHYSAVECFVVVTHSNSASQSDCAVYLNIPSLRVTRAVEVREDLAAWQGEH